MPPASTKAPPVGTCLSGGYELTRFLGAGGMSHVYEARNADGESVAVKVLLGVRGGPSESSSRFAREAQIAGDLDHPNLVPVLASGTDKKLEVPYMVMPLLSGLDLAALIARVGPLHPTIAVRIIRQVCSGLTAAHDSGVVHRDIKPGNIFLDHDSTGQVRARLLDFGVAKQVQSDQSLTRSGTMIGTPVYMAPEHISEAKHVDHRADIWSLGLTLYNALTAYVPFSHLDSYTAIVLAVHQESIPHIQDAAPWLDPALATIVHGALLRLVERRCPDSQTFADALAPFNGGEDTIGAEQLVAADPALRRTERPRAQLSQSWIAIRPQHEVPEVEVDEPDDLLNRTIGGQYTLKRLIGDGGMGAVYEAHANDGARVALKVIKSGPQGMSRRARLRFIREARLLIDIKHENVVRVLDADTDAEREQPFIVMELLQGRDLQSYINEHNALEPGPIARLFATACRALGAAHELGIVHRDLKPANVFLHEHVDGNLTVKVCDFGVAKRLGVGNNDTTAVTHTGGVVGSPVYMSPEQTKDAGAIDTRSDIWSMGIALYQALSGDTPWCAYGTVGQLIVAICTEELPHLQDTAPWIRQGLAEVVHKALARRPEMRFQTAEEFAKALDPFADDALNRQQLVAVRRRERKHVRQRAAPPDSITMEHAAVMSHTVQDGATTATVDRTRAFAAAAAAILLVGGSLAYLLLGPSSTKHDAPPMAKASSVPTAPSAAPPVRLQARVPVHPASAIVTVNGRLEKLEGGAFRLQGEAGDSFDVVAAVDDRKTSLKLILSKDGRVSPASITVPSSSAAPPRAPSARPSSTKIPQARKRAPKRLPPQAKPSAVATAKPSAAPPAPPPTELKPRDEWQ